MLPIKASGVISATLSFPCYFNSHTILSLWEEGEAYKVNVSYFCCLRNISNDLLWTSSVMSLLLFTSSFMVKATHNH